MKNLLTSILLVFLVASTAGAAVVHHDAIDVKEAKEKNLFVFKASKKLLGASVEVIQSNGEVVAGQILAKRKMIIDFSDVREGSYTIRITKGNLKEEFKYAKK